MKDPAETILETYNNHGKGVTDSAQMFILVNNIKKARKDVLYKPAFSMQFSWTQTEEIPGKTPWNKK